MEKQKKIKRDCIWYDYGRSAPTAYGAFCEKKMKGIESVSCNNCNFYQIERRSKIDRRKNG